MILASSLHFGRGEPDASGWDRQRVSYRGLEEGLTFGRADCSGGVVAPRVEPIASRCREAARDDESVHRLSGVPIRGPVRVPGGKDSLPIFRVVRLPDSPQH